MQKSLPWNKTKNYAFGISGGKWFWEVIDVPNSDKSVFSTSVKQIFAWNLDIIYRRQMGLLRSQNLIRHSSIKEMNKSLVGNISNLRRRINIPASTLNTFIRNSFMDNLIPWESRIQNRNSFILRTCKKNRNIYLIPLNFVDFGGMVVGSVYIWLLWDVPDFDRAVGRAWCQHAEISCV